MIGPLHRFIEALRAEGVTVSPSEVLDAARAAAAVGPEDRRRFRAALSMTLAKDRLARDRFDAAFERFFAAPARGGAGEGKGERGGAGGTGGARGGTSATGDHRPPSRPDDESAPGPSRRPTRPPRPAPTETPPRRTLRALPSEEVRRELGKARAAEGAPSRRVVDPSKRRPSPRAGEASAAPPPVAAGAPSRKARLSKLLASEIPQLPSLSGDARRRDLVSHLTPADERELAREIPRLVQEIRLRHARRMRRAPRGRLFMKRAIRENLATGGVPFRIPMRQVRRKRPRVVLIVDVSWSVATASGLFLLLAMEFLRLDRRARILFFVDHPVEATDAVRGWLKRSPRSDGASARTEGTGSAATPGASDRRGARPGAPSRGPAYASGPASWTGRAGRARGGRREAATGVLSPGTGRSFADLLAGLGGVDPGAPSDYGRAFWALAEGPLRVLGRDAVLVVLGDARTNRFDPLPWAFEEIAGRARRVLWLAPEPRVLWGSGDSALPRYLPFCDVAVEVRDLDGLAHGVREMVASL